MVCPSISGSILGKNRLRDENGKVRWDDVVVGVILGVWEEGKGGAKHAIWHSLFQGHLQGGVGWGWWDCCEVVGWRCEGLLITVISIKHLHFSYLNRCCTGGRKWSVGYLLTLWRNELHGLIWLLCINWMNLLCCLALAVSTSSIQVREIRASRVVPGPWKTFILFIFSWKQTRCLNVLESVPKTPWNWNLVL